MVNKVFFAFLVSISILVFPFSQDDFSDESSDNATLLHWSCN